MNHLTLAYVNQTDRERDIKDDLRARQLLHPSSEPSAPVETVGRTSVGPKPAPMRARTAGR
jgi:hypothetical protein